MRVERFSLFFPPKIWSACRRGETEYGIGAIPLGGFVKITGMNPDEELPPEVAPRAYYHQPVWKRIVVIAAGPAMNFAVAFVILFAPRASALATATDDVGRRRRVGHAGRRGSCSRATGSSSVDGRVRGAAATTGSTTSRDQVGDAQLRRASRPTAAGATTPASICGRARRPGA